MTSIQHEAAPLLTELISAALAADLLPTGLFLAERLHALDPQHETAAYFYSLALWRNGEAAAALEVLRRPVRTGVHNTRARHDKPACEVSIRCAWTYAQCCSRLGRPREGEVVLAKVIKATGSQQLPTPPSATLPTSVSLQIGLAKLSLQARQPMQAQAYFRAALRDCWWCWEAFEGLCALGAPPDIDACFGATTYETAFAFPAHPNGIDPMRAHSENSAFFTPAESGVRPNGPGVPARFLAGPNLSLDDSVGPSDQSYYALNNRLRPAAHRAYPASNAATGPAGSAYTPDHADMPSTTVPAKRQRPRSAASLDLPPLDIKPAARSLRTSADPTAKHRAPDRSPTSTDGGNVRRSTRLSRGGGADKAPSSEPQATSPVRGRPRMVSGNTRPTKKSRAASTASRSSSVDAPDGAEEWLRGIYRCFGQAVASMSTYDCTRALEVIRQLPAEQRQSWRALTLRGRAEYESLEYRAAEVTLTMARNAGGQHLLQTTEMLSTLLWHLRKPKELSFLAQDLMAASPSSSQAWIATGNVFSHLEDHANALKCFRRATQADASLAYSYTLAGHECVALEEWDRALRFFREALQRDPRHYNAWFGIGNVYLKTGKLRLADYHFRKATAINPSNAVLVCGVGSVLEKQTKFKDALELYERAVVLAPQNPAVRFKRARMFLALRKNDAAMRDLQWLAGKAPNEFNVHFLLAKLYGARGDNAQMVLHMTCAQELEPRRAHRVREAIEEAAQAKQTDESEVMEE